jgi:hypothetical protein
MESRLNKMVVGLILGLLVPVIALYIYNLVAFDQFTFGEFLRAMISRKKISAVISLGVIPNLLVFFSFIWLNYLYSARGVIAATLVFGALVVVTKYLI